MLRRIMRIGLSIILLVGVWMNAHWTIALTMTLFAVNLESTRLYLRQEQGYRVERQKTEWKLFKKAKKLKQDIENLQDKTKNYAKHLQNGQPKAST